MSNYFTDADRWNHVESGTNSDEEKICARCKGLGEDKDGADCVFCEGFGSVIIR